MKFITTIFISVISIFLQTSTCENITDFTHSTRDDDSVTKTTLEPNKENCEKLGKKLTPYATYLSCCNFPEFNISNIKDEECDKSCEGENTNRCCIDVCLMKKAGYLIYTSDPNVMPKTNVQGLINVVQASEDFNEAWRPIVHKIVVKCHENAIKSDHPLNNRCRVIPFSYFTTQHCANMEMFLNCPQEFQNKTLSNECTTLRQYVSNC